MEYTFEKELIPCLAYGVREYQTQELTQEIKLGDGLPDIGRVLGAWGQVILRSKEWQQNAAMATGGVMVWCLYMPEDGSEPRCIEGWMPYKLTWNVSAAEQDGYLFVSPLLRFVDCRSISARKLMLRAGVAAAGQVLQHSELSVFHEKGLPSDVELLKNSYPVRIPVENGEKSFVLDEELSMQEQTVPMEKLLRYNVHPEILEHKVMTDKVVFRGNAEFEILYLGTDGLLHTNKWQLSFSQFTELDNSFEADSTSELQIAVTSLELDRTESGFFHLKCGLLAQYLILDARTIELTEDAYATGCAATPKLEELLLPVMLDLRQENLPIECEISGVQADVIEVFVLPDYPKIVSQDNGQEIRCSGVAQLLYYDESRSLQSCTARWEKALEMPAADGSILLPTVSAGPCTVAFNPDNVQILGQIDLSVRTWASKGIPAAVGVSYAESSEREERKPSVILYRCQGSSLWEIAKHCRARLTDIQVTNHLQSEPETGTVLLIPIPNR